MLEQLDEAAAFFGRGELYRRNIYAIRIAVNHFFSDTARLKKSCRRCRFQIGSQGRTVVEERHGVKS